MSKLPEWVSTDEQNEKFGEASAFGAPDSVLSTEKATDGFIRIKKSMMQSAANQGFHFSLLYYSYSCLLYLISHVSILYFIFSSWPTYSRAYLFTT